MKQSKELTKMDWEQIAFISVLFMSLPLIPFGMLIHKILVKSDRNGLIDTDPRTGEHILNLNFTAFKKKS